MWLKNFDMACATNWLGTTGLPQAAGAQAGQDGHNYCRNTDGAWFDARYYPSGAQNQLVPSALALTTYMSSYSSGFGACFGTGTTSPTYDDYRLETPTADGYWQFSTSSDVKTYDQSSKRFVRTSIADYLNKSGTDITVTEIGVGGLLTNSNRALFLREVLDTPVTVHAGEYIRVTLSYEVSAYPNKPTVTATTV